MHCGNLGCLILRRSGLKGRARIGLITVIEEEFTAAQQVFQVHTNIPGTPYFAESNPAGRDWDLILTQATDRTNVPFSGEVSISSRIFVLKCWFCWVLLEDCVTGEV